MRNVIISAAAVSVLGLPCVGHAADAFSAISVPQAAGYTQATMSVDDTMAVARQLSAASTALSKAAPAEGNTASTVQFGSYNNAEIQQSGSRNVSFVAQSGFYNSAIVQQTGTAHQSMIVQKGVGNTAVVTQR